MMFPRLSAVILCATILDHLVLVLDWIRSLTSSMEPAAVLDIATGTHSSFSSFRIGNAFSEVVVVGHHGESEKASFATVNT
ncbi:hypothetical protein Tco_0143868 [Tanacetum coccineum]